MCIFIVAGLAAAALAYGYNSECRRWNGGTSPAGQPWRQFDTDSQGGRGYTDDSGNTIWISYPRVDS